MQIPNSRHVVAADKVLTREVDGELVLLDLKTETYLGLDETGTRMWEALTTAATVEEAVGLLLEQYAVEEATLRADLENLLLEMTERGLVVVRDGSR